MLNRAPKPPHVLNPRVPEALSAMCMRLLAKEPEERHPDAEALCAELEALLAQADESWDVKLCDTYGPDTATTIAEVPHAGEDELMQWLKKHKARPRRGPRLRAEGAAHDPHPHAADSRAELLAPTHGRPGPTPPTPQTRAAYASVLRAAAWVGLLVFLSVGVLAIARNLRPFPTPVARHVLEPHPGAASFSPSTSPAFMLALWAPGQEVAAPWMPPEAHEAAGPLDGASTLAAVAIPATFSEEKASVKMKKNTGVFPEPEPQRPRGGAVGKALGLGAAACLELACPGPQVRPTPPPEACPPGAVEAMSRLRIDYNEDVVATFFATVEEGVSRNITVRAGPTTVHLGRPLGNLPTRTTLSGRLIIGEDRVYGRLTEARTPKGDRFPVCMQIIENDAIGLKKEPNDGSNSASVYPYFDVKAVRRFE